MGHIGAQTGKHNRGCANFVGVSGFRIFQPLVKKCELMYQMIIDCAQWMVLQYYIIIK
jgi:hypothetical protein